jgi:hypothetical protein
LVCVLSFFAIVLGFKKPDASVSEVNSVGFILTLIIMGIIIYDIRDITWRWID